MEQRLQPAHPGPGTHFEPFPGVQESLRQLHAVADLAVVSAANESAIASEWKRYGLAQHADIIFGQEVGSKANSIATMLACGYESRKGHDGGRRHGGTPRQPPPTGWLLCPFCPGGSRELAALQDEALPQACCTAPSAPISQAELLAALRSALHG